MLVDKQEMTREAGGERQRERGTAAQTDGQTEKNGRKQMERERQ